MLLRKLKGTFDSYWEEGTASSAGTGTTVLAAFDVARLPAEFPEGFPSPDPPSLLLIAHRHRGHGR